MSNPNAIHLDRANGRVHRRFTVTDTEVRQTNALIEKANIEFNDPDFIKEHGHCRLTECVPADLYYNGMLQVLEAFNTTSLGNIDKGKQNEIMADYLKSNTWKDLKDV